MAWGEAGPERQDLLSEAPLGTHSIHDLPSVSGMSLRERERLGAQSQCPRVWELTGFRKPWEGVRGGTLLCPWSQYLVACGLYKSELQINPQPTRCSYHVLIVAPFILFFAKQV